jgi:hypothetical protein
MIDIDYFSNSRVEFFELMFHFIKLVKPENKKKIRLNILTTQQHVNFFTGFNNERLGFEYNVVVFKDGFNYTDKLKHVINLSSDYSIKIDEDCFINNHIWDYLIENCNVLDDLNNLLVSPMLSTSQPSCDEFINGFLSEDEKSIIKAHLLAQKMPNGLFGVNYESLNEFTINADSWNPDKYYRALDKIPTDTKGMHPIRVSYKAQTQLNDMIVDNVDKLIGESNYNMQIINAPYFTINLFMIKTSVWRDIYNTYGGSYDEIAISKYRKDSNKNFLFVKNGYGIHTMYNTIYGNKNKWGIGGVDSQEKENNFIKELKKIIL